MGGASRRASTANEFLPGYEASIWFGIGAPRNTPLELIDKLNMEITSGLAMPQISARLTALGNMPMRMRPADFGRLVAEEVDKWATVIKFSGAKVE